MAERQAELTTPTRASRNFRSVPPPNDFLATDQQYFEGNGRLTRLRPPTGDELQGYGIAVAELGFVPMLLVVRTTTQTEPRPICLMALSRSVAESLFAEMARFGESELRAVITKPGVVWWPLPIA